MSDLPLPDLHQGTLDEAGLNELFTQLADHTEVQAVLLKGGAPRSGRPDEAELAAALVDFLAGRARGIQVRYRFDGGDWSDTVLRVEGGFKVVRMRSA